jgi:hypothetical protein
VTLRDNLIRDAWRDVLGKRPTRDMLLKLPLLSVGPSLEIDYPAADPELLVDLAKNAETVTQTIQLGLSAIGHLLAHVGPEIEAGEIPSDLIEALGWTMAELGDFAAITHCLSAACRRHTSDYAPKIPRVVPNATI